MQNISSNCKLKSSVANREPKAIKSFELALECMQLKSAKY